MDESDSILSALEIIKDRLYFVTFKTSAKPKNTVNSQYFCTDELFVYESFYWDFGPLNICHVYNYCELVGAKLSAKSYGRKKIIHYTSASPQKRLNAAFLVGAYAIIELKKTAEEAYAMLTRGDPPSFMKFRDASNITPVFEIGLQECLAGLEKALKFRFFDITDFNSEEYEYYERVEYGDLNWIVPGKFLAMCGPHRVAAIVKGYPQHAPESYFEYFREHDVLHVVRLNCKSYDAKQFTDFGFKHLEMFFPDGSCPNDAIMQQFLQYCEQTSHAIAVHCKAGLGRTGSLIGAYMVKHYGFTALEAIAWLRLCRPGSVIGHQQRWLEDKQQQLWVDGEKYRKRHNLSGPPVHESGIYSNYGHQVARDKLSGISNQVNNINLNDESSSFDEMNNNGESGDGGHNDSNNNDDKNNNNNGDVDEVDEASTPVPVAPPEKETRVVVVAKSAATTETVTRRSAAPKPPPRLKSARVAAAASVTGGSGGTATTVKTQGDELNEIKATRRRHTRSHNFDHSSHHNHHHHSSTRQHNLTTDPTAPTTAVLQRFVAKYNNTAKGKEGAAAASSNDVVGSPMRRTRMMKMMSSDKTASTGGAAITTTVAATPTTTCNTAASTATSGSGAASVMAKNMRNSANLLDNANNNFTTLSSKQRNKRSIHERENNTAASKISRRYASTTMAVQQKQKEPVHTSTLVVKKVMITPVINSKTYPGPKRSTF